MKCTESFQEVSKTIKNVAYIVVLLVLVELLPPSRVWRGYAAEELDDAGLSAVREDSTTYGVCTAATVPIRARGSNVISGKSSSQTTTAITEGAFCRENGVCQGTRQ